MIPKNPATIAINGWLIENNLKDFQKRYLPNYEIEITSGYRDIEKNREVGGTADSAHIYNLARDFILKNKQTGEIISDFEMKRIYNDFIAPNWDGWSQFTPKQPNTNTGWIHAGLSRSLTDYTKYIGFAATAAGIAFGVRKLITRMKGAVR